MIRRLTLALAGGVLAATVMVAVWCGLLQWGGNFDAVIPGEVYRSAQPSPRNLEDWSKRYGIRSVVNLRGAAPGAGWYQAEVEAARALGLTLIDLPMSDTRQIDTDEAAHLLQALRDAPKPMLIHCRAGSDRTGLASALYAYAQHGASEGAAEWQLSLLYGHIALPFARSWPMDLSWEALEPWLGIKGS